jgi:hypothetical protein
MFYGSVPVTCVLFDGWLVTSFEPLVMSFFFNVHEPIPLLITVGMGNAIDVAFVSYTVSTF